VITTRTDLVVARTLDLEGIDGPVVMGTRGPFKLVKDRADGLDGCEGPVVMAGYSVA
jgi:predicted phage-related endonuclease